MKRILIATRTDINSRGGSAFHLRNLKEWLEKNGHVVDVAQLWSGAYDEPADKMAFITHPVYIYDVVIADYSWMTPVLDLAKDDALKICFVHDLRCRIIPCLEATGYKDTQGWTEEKEAVLLRKADILLVLNNEDAEFCKRMAPNAKIIRIGIAMESVDHDPEKEISGRCIYVGSNNMENQYAIGWFEREVWPKVLGTIPHATLDKVMGSVDDLEKHYAEAQLAVVPHIMKGGLKIKVAEAFAHGLTVVGNVCAFDGFGPQLGDTDDPLEMAEKIIYVLKDDDYRIGISEVQIMTPQTAYGELLRVLE